jgi:hypothetical protein
MKRESGARPDEGIWWYAVSEGPRAVSLIVLAPEEDLRSLLPSYLRAQISYHSADPEGSTCQYVEGGRCSLGGSLQAGGRLWQEYGDPTKFEQPEAFWLALEAELAE